MTTKTLVLTLLLACLAVANSSTPAAENMNPIPIGLFARLMRNIKQTVDALKNTPGTRRICVWKVCSFTKYQERQPATEISFQQELANKIKSSQRRPMAGFKSGTSMIWMKHA